MVNDELAATVRAALDAYDTAVKDYERAHEILHKAMGDRQLQYAWQAADEYQISREKAERIERIESGMSFDVLHTYRALLAERDQLVAVADAARAWVNAYPDYHTAMGQIKRGLPVNEVQDLEITEYQKARVRLFAVVAALDAE